MDRSLTIGATGGTFSAIALRLLADITGAPPNLPFPVDCPLCPEVPWLNFSYRLDFVSLLLGIFIGLSVGPFLDFCYIVRQSWRLWVRERLESLAGEPRENTGLYEFLQYLYCCFDFPGRAVTS
jgi:hypothetical protein